jgi:predicted ATPase
MLHLRSIALKEIDKREESYPFSLPVVRDFPGIAFQAPVTFFVGENGSGKSTCLEALAVAAGSITAGREDLVRDGTMAGARALGDALRLTWNKRTNRGFFLRAEDFLGYTERTQQLERDLHDMAQDFEERFEGEGRTRAVGSAMGQRHAIVDRYGPDLHARSHGESFLQFFEERFVPGGLYLLDEPETPLSPQRQLALLAMLKDMLEQDAQFIVATHSPILMAFPDAVIYSFDEAPLREVAFDDLDHVTFTRDFLNAPERFLRHL